MFGSKEKCAICGEKLSKLTAIHLKDGSICPMCNRLTTESPLASVQEVKAAWDENHRRFQEFKETMVASDFGSGFIFLDMDHQYFYLSNSKKPKSEPAVFKFSEIDEYTIQKVGQKTITKSKGGIGRAVVGGAVFGLAGAVVGAATAKTETKTTGGIDILKVSVSKNGLKSIITESNPPLKAEAMLNEMMNVE